MLNIAGAALFFNLAQWNLGCQGFILLFAVAMYRLGGEPSPQRAFRAGLAAGLLCYGIQLRFFYNIFGLAAVPLWTIFALFFGLFGACLQFIRQQHDARNALFAAPILWLGWEYFRSECYPLKFTWLTLGYAFGDAPSADWILWIGCYGIGAIVMLLAAIAYELWHGKRWQQAIVAILVIGFLYGVTFGNAGAGTLSGERLDVDKAMLNKQVIRSLSVRTNGITPPPTNTATLQITGIQTEFRTESEILMALILAVSNHPNAQVLMLSEIAFQTPVPERIKNWASVNKRYLVAGGKHPNGSDFENSVFVINPAGQIVFRQCKSVPIQFFKDGLPAKEQIIWESPWGRIAMPVCYDLGFTRICDHFIEKGAQAMLVPAMDMVEWGADAYRLNARITRMRAAEYRIPIFRVASSGISQWIEPGGQTMMKTSCGSVFDVINGQLTLGRPGRIPPDRWLCLPCMVLAWAVLAWMFWSTRNRH